MDDSMIVMVRMRGEDLVREARRSRLAARLRRAARARRTGTRAAGRPVIRTVSGTR